MTDPALEKKRRVAQAALPYIRHDAVLGVGTGTTVEVLIDLLADAGLLQRLPAAVSSSDRTTRRLQAAGVRVLDLNEVGQLPLYVDGADEATRQRELIKGGGAALTREKIAAACAERFVCIVDEGKLVERLGRFPLPVEVIPMARSYVARRLAALGGRPAWRQAVVTDNGNHILDVHDLAIDQPARIEELINQITGVVSVGLFAARPADVLLVGYADRVETL